MCRTLECETVLSCAVYNIVLKEQIIAHEKHSTYPFYFINL